MFILIGSLVLLIACINFINLTTARSEKRAREVGVRKAIGSQRKDLIIQFLSESLSAHRFSFWFLRFVCAYGASRFQFPYKQQHFHSIFQSGFLGDNMVSAVLFTALIAGSRPAFYLSSFDPVKVLKGGDCSR